MNIRLPIRLPILVLLLFCTALIKLQAQDSLGISIITDTIVVRVSSDYKQGLTSKDFNQKTLKSYKANSISDLLARETGVYIKQYGSGLATATSRGAGANHTALLWEGINIANPLLGQNDLSILPIVFIDQLSWQASPASALDGNAALGGSIKLASYVAYNSQWKGESLFSFGSFGRKNQQVRLSYGGKRYAMNFGLFHQTALNNFKYKDLNAFGSPKPWIRQNHAFQEALGIIHSQKVSWKSQELSLKSWYQQNFRELPPTLLQTTSNEEEQRDASWRNLLKWRNINEKRLQRLHFAWIWNKLNYQSNAISSNSQTRQGLLRWQENWLLSKIEQNWQHQLSYRVEGEHQQAQSSNFSQIVQQYLLALGVQYKLEHQNLTLNLSLREQWVSGEFLRPAAALNGNLKLWQQDDWLLSMQVAFSHNYRYPTFNDRYWPNVGNPKLKAEYSWSQEASFLLAKQPAHGFFLNSVLTIYSNWVSNWIMWVPDGSLWRPENLAKVWARGLESSLRFGRRWANSSELGCRMRHQWTLAERRDLAFYGRQLIYTPIHKLNTELYYQDRKMSIRYQHQLVSSRYLNYSNSMSLAAFQLADLVANYELKLSPLLLNFQFRLNNIWGNEYYLVSNYPMPRQNIELNLVINY